MYIISHGEAIEHERVGDELVKVYNGGLTPKGRDDVANVIKKIKKAQNPNNPKENYISDIITSDSKACVETAIIAAEILNVDIDKTPFYENVPKYCSEEEFRIKVIVSLLLRGKQEDESMEDFYRKVEILLNDELVKKIGYLYYSLDSKGTPSPLLLRHNNYWRFPLIVTDSSMINAIYRYYGSYNPTIKNLAEQQLLAKKDSVLYRVFQSQEGYYNEATNKTLILHAGIIRKCDYEDF